MSKPFLITFTDGNKQHVNRRELDALQPHLKLLGNRRFLCTIPYRTVRVTATENTCAQMAMSPLESFDRWPGPDVIVVAPDGRHCRECGVESPYSTMARVQSHGTVSPL